MVAHARPVPEPRGDRARRRLVRDHRRVTDPDGVAVDPPRAGAARSVDLAAELGRIGRAAGLVAVGVARAEAFPSVLDELVRRRDAGLHDGMAFTYRHPERSADVTGALPGAASLVVGAAPYPAELPPAPGGSVGQVARYAVVDEDGASPHDRLVAALVAMAARLRSDGWRTRVLADDNALVDREAALRAGLGWYGRSANLLVPGHGPWVVLGSVLTDAVLPVAGRRVPDGCGTCRRCHDGCPTGAIVEAGVVDARRCLSWQLQRTGTFPRDLRVALGDRIYGCDECSAVCPPGRAPAGGGTATAGAGAWVDVVGLLGLDDAALLAEVGRWYVPGREARWVRRNALVVLGNVGDPGDAGVQRALADHLAHPDGLLRAHALWAARRLGLDELAGRLAGDGDPDVAAERAAPPPPPVASAGDAG